jgi:hypothetical protein
MERITRREDVMGLQGITHGKKVQGGVYLILEGIKLIIKPWGLGIYPIIWQRHNSCESD